MDDRERAERVTEFVAGHIDFEWLKQRCGTPRELRLSPPAFRYQVVQRAQKAGKRIVLPEGSEPRTDVANNANLGAEEKAAKLKALDEELAKLEKRMAEREQKTAANAG